MVMSSVQPNKTTLAVLLAHAQVWRQGPAHPLCVTNQMSPRMMYWTSRCSSQQVQCRGLDVSTTLIHAVMPKCRQYHDSLLTAGRVRGVGVRLRAETLRVSACCCCSATHFQGARMKEINQGASVETATELHLSAMGGEGGGGR